MVEEENRMVNSASPTIIIQNVQNSQTTEYIIEEQEMNIRLPDANYLEQQHAIDETKKYDIQ
jgi:hypothetical protein